MFEITLGWGIGGYYVEWYREDQDGNPWTARWYGSREACEARAQRPAPRQGWLQGFAEERSYADAIRD